MDVFIVSGFLGSGKTTLIKHLLTSPVEGIGKIALIVNEVGEVGIDGTLLSGQNVDMVEITSGCICCTLKTDFSKAVQEIHDRITPDFLVVEATGVAQPGDILNSLLDPPMNEYSRLRGLVTVVNADIFKAREVFGLFYDNQIRCADSLVLNKTDLVTPESVQEIQVVLRELNPGAVIFPTRYCAVEPSQLLRAESDDLKAHHHAPHDHDHPEEGGFQTFSFKDGHPMDREKLDEFLKSLPPTLFRLKGWVRFPEASAYLDYASGRYRIVPMDEQRSTALAFVGRNCDEIQILNTLKNCMIQEPVDP